MSRFITKLKLSAPKIQREQIGWALVYFFCWLSDKDIKFVQQEVYQFIPEE